MPAEGQNLYDFERARPDGAEQIGPPKARWALAEGARFPAELVSGIVWDLVSPRIAVGRARTVLVVPGFMATDAMTAPLRLALARDGHRVHASGLGRMVGLTDAILDGLIARIDALVESEGAPITLVGWSFGGMLSRWAAHLRPDVIDHVVTVGSPWQATGEITRVTPMFQLLTRRYPLSSRASEVVGQAREELPVPVTSVFSATDGLVPWQACAVEEGPAAENISVPSSHTGLMSNPLAVGVIRHRIAQDPPLRTRFTWGGWVAALSRRPRPIRGASA